MAKVQYGEMIADMRGKINGSVHSRNRAGAYMRNKVTPVNPSTTFQTNVRNRLAARSQAWRGLSQAQRNAWNAAVGNFKKTNVFGQLRTPSGINLYSRLNLNLINIGEAAITDPPLPVAVDSFTSLALAASVGGGTITATFTPVIAADHKVIMETTEPLSPGINFVKSQYRQIGILDNAATSPYDLATEYQTKFGSFPAEGSKIFLRLTQVELSTGIPSIPIEASAIVGA
jgi:hypothetical protein